MNRRVVIGLSVSVIATLALAAALAMTGTQVDNLRLEREDLEFEVEDLRAEQETLQGERDSLKAQVDEQQRTIDQLKTELERLHSQAQPQGTETTAGPASGTATSTP